MSAPHERNRGDYCSTRPGGDWTATNKSTWLWWVLCPSLEMLLYSVLITIYALPALIRGKQIPLVDGVIGGVPSPDACNLDIPTGPILDNDPIPPKIPPTSGKLRGVVENSGICGGLFCPRRVSCHIDSLGRNHTRCLSGFRIWCPECASEHLVCLHVWLFSLFFILF